MSKTTTATSNVPYGVLDPYMWRANHTIPTGEIIGMIDACLSLGEVDGFINPVAVSAVLWLYLAARLFPDMSDKLDEMAKSDDGVFGTMDYLQKDGIINKLCDEYADDVTYAFNIADSWYRQYAKFAPTFAGQVGKMSFLTEDSVKSALEGVQKLVSEGNADKIVQLANDWGMNNEPPVEEK